MLFIAVLLYSVHENWDIKTLWQAVFLCNPIQKALMELYKRYFGVKQLAYMWCKLFNVLNWYSLVR